MAGFAKLAEMLVRWSIAAVINSNSYFEEMQALSSQSRLTTVLFLFLGGSCILSGVKVVTAIMGTPNAIIKTTRTTSFCLSREDGPYIYCSKWRGMSIDSPLRIGSSFVLSFEGDKILCLLQQSEFECSIADGCPFLASALGWRWETATIKKKIVHHWWCCDLNGCICCTLCWNIVFDSKITKRQNYVCFADTWRLLHSAFLWLVLCLMASSPTQPCVLLCNFRPATRNMLFNCSWMEELVLKVEPYCALQDLLAGWPSWRTWVQNGLDVSHEVDCSCAIILDGRCFRAGSRRVVHVWWSHCHTGVQNTCFLLTVSPACFFYSLKDCVVGGGQRRRSVGDFCTRRRVQGCSYVYAESVWHFLQSRAFEKGPLPWGVRCFGWCQGGQTRRERPYNDDSTASRPLCEVKHHLA